MIVKCKKCGKERLMMAKGLCNSCYQQIMNKKKSEF